MGFKSLVTGVSGLKAQSKKMEVIGNNLANVNTAGFKKDRVLFHDTFYQVMKEASSGDGAEFGGTDPMAIGSGVQISSVDTLFNQGTKTSTGRSMDFMIEGDDFFVVKNGATSELMLTRNGAFQLDGEMKMVDAVGNKVMGYTVDRETGALSASAGEITISNGTIAANATTQVTLSDNIDSSSSEKQAGISTSAWEIFSGGDNFGKLSNSIIGSTGSRITYGSGFYQDSVNYTDTSATMGAGLATLVLSSSPANLIEGFSVGDTISLVQGSSQVQRTISAINTATRTITVSTAAPSSFSATTTTVSNITDGTASLGSSGSSSIHSDILRSQIAMVDANGRLLGSFYKASGEASEYTRASATITGGGGSVILGTGEFSTISDLKELVERTLIDTQLTHYSASNDLDVSIDKFGAITFGGTGLVQEFRLVINAENTEMLDRFSGISMTDASTTATTQARLNSSGEIIATPSLAMGTRSSHTSKSWFNTSGIESYGYTSSSSATEYGEYAGLRLDGGTDGSGYGLVQLSLTNALGNTVTQQYKLVSSDATANESEFSTLGELANLIQTTLRTDSFSSLASDSALTADLTASASIENGRLKIKTSNGSFRNLSISAVNTTTDSASGIARSDQDNFDTVLGQLAQGINGKEGSSNTFLAADLRLQTRVHDSLGNEHTVVNYFIRDRSAGLSNIEWKFVNKLQPNVNTFSENSPNDKSVYRETYNSIQDTATSRGVLAFDVNSGAVLSSTDISGDSRYVSSSNVTFLPQLSSLEASTSSIAIDFSGLTSFNGDHTATGTDVDGYKSGSLIRIASEESTGRINGIYSNGQLRNLARIGLMDVDNPEGLLKVGTSYYTQTANSNSGGTVKGLDSVLPIGGTEGTTTNGVDSRVHGNSLEASNVDLTEELTEMIITQRSYSASGKIITTSDDMLQEALSLKR